MTALGEGGGRTWPLFKKYHSAIKLTATLAISCDPRTGLSVRSITAVRCGPLPASAGLRLTSSLLSLALAAARRGRSIITWVKQPFVFLWCSSSSPYKVRSFFVNLPALSKCSKNLNNAGGGCCWVGCDNAHARTRAGANTHAAADKLAAALCTNLILYFSLFFESISRR